MYLFCFVKLLLIAVKLTLKPAYLLLLRNEKCFLANKKHTQIKEMVRETIEGCVKH